MNQAWVDMVMTDLPRAWNLWTRCQRLKSRPRSISHIQNAPVDTIVSFLIENPPNSDSEEEEQPTSKKPKPKSTVFRGIDRSPGVDNVRLSLWSRAGAQPFTPPDSDAHGSGSDAGDYYNDNYGLDPGSPRDGTFCRQPIYTFRQWAEKTMTTFQGNQPHYVGDRGHSNMDVDGC